jgi:ABC-type multidrug transport system fused ATPase/permease subunit
MWAKAKMGEDSYKEALEILAELKKDEAKKGTFVAIQGDIDKRGPEMMDLQLHPGFNIQCGIKGSKLSGGQKQRIAIARAIIRRPQILILDEATSALDEESQRKVQVALDNIMKERTSIVIAHRLTTIEKCDRIMVLESGRLVEEGAFTELKLKDGGIFAQLASGMQNPCKF